ncbi:unnamed protein product, partial [marine sediment metagenome]
MYFVLLWRLLFELPRSTPELLFRRQHIVSHALLGSEVFSFCT